MTDGVTYTRRLAGDRTDMDIHVADIDEEKLFPNSIVFSPVLQNTQITNSPPTSLQITNIPPDSRMDFYTQAFKALSYRSPFDVPEAASGQHSVSNAVGGGSSSSVATVRLPSRLAHLLNRHTDGKKRQRKLHSASDFKSSKRSEKARTASNLWTQTEDYFRELTVEDIQRLHKLSNFRFSGNESYFTIPRLTTADSKVDSRGNGNSDVVESKVKTDVNGVEVKKEMEADEDDVHQYTELDSVVKELSSVELHKEDNMEVKGEESRERENGDKDDKNERRSSVFSGVEWLLGSRSKIYLTSERPSKKRKLLGGDAGLEKLLVAHPVEGSRSLCHYCSFGDTGDQLNRLIMCSSCGVAVHQRCYGVQEDVCDSWFCSWCKQKMKHNMQLNAERPCSLCPKKNGALKLARKKDSGSENEGSLEFVHLFCCQWIPEVYVENTRTMEPIMNMDTVNDTRKKLVCYLCKDKCGACVRCSNGACRTSFHPICAREAMHRMEIWGKLGYDEVELRAFCCKHSQNSSSQHIRTISSAGSNSLPLKNGPVLSSSNLPKLKILLENRDTEDDSAETADSESDLSKRKDVAYQEDLADSGSKFKLKNDAEDAVVKESLLKSFNVDINPSDSLNFTMILKMLVERGKVDVEDIANDTGIPVDVLASIVTDNCVSPDLHSKIVKWLKDHTYLGSFRKPLKVKIRSPKAESVVGDPSIISVPKSSVPHVVPVKSVPPRRRTNSSLRILQETTLLSMPKEISQKDGMGLNEFRDCISKMEEPDLCNRGLPSNEHKILVDSMNSPKILSNDSFECEVDPAKPSNGSSENGLAEISSVGDRSYLTNADIVKFKRRFPAKDTLDLMKPESKAGSSVHPLVSKKLLECIVLMNCTSGDCDGGRHVEVPTVPVCLSSGIISDQCTSDLVSLPNGEKLDQLSQTDLLGLSESSPEDEVEGELIFYQNRLMCNAVARKRFADDLIFKVVKGIPLEIDSARKQKWDAVSLNQHLYGLREAKKQGRKERRHKEAQVVLAAATAAAAASSRSSSLRKDVLEDSAQQETVGKFDASNGTPVYSSQLIPRAKDALLRSGGARLSTEKTSDFLHLALDASRESSRVCDVCRRAETLLNSIVVCSSCKVAVHLDCYYGIHNFTGPWHCELCEELSSTIGPGATTFNSWGKPYFVPECELCGGTAGAFRKATDGKWVHAFCAEWVLGSTFRRGQINPVEGMDMISKGHDLCIVCRRDHGVCLKCHYGHCQSTFHPSCGRSAGFYMNSRVTGGKLQNKAYCEKHSLEQRAKAENQRHGVEEMKGLKQVRVELERLRLLCERIIKREKLKRELIICSQHILASKRENILLPTRFRHPMLQPEISSESVTTSVKAFPESCKSGSEVMQRSDDVTVDSTVAGKRCINFSMHMDNDQKTDDSSTSQHPPMQKPVGRLSSGGKQIPQRLSPEVSQIPSPPSKSTSDDREKQAKLRMHTDTFEKELIMTSDQASMKNQRLPKGYVYVPIKSLSKEKETVPDACPGETDG